MNLRSLLLQFRWDDNFKDINHEIDIFFESRGYPNNIQKIAYSEIQHIGKKFLRIESSATFPESILPIHRIRKIVNRVSKKIYFSSSP